MVTTMSDPGEEILHLLVGGCRQLCLHKRGDGRIGHFHKVGASKLLCCLLFDRIRVPLNMLQYSHFFRAEVDRLGGNQTLIEVLDQLKDWEED